MRFKLEGDGTVLNLQHATAEHHECKVHANRGVFLIGEEPVHEQSVPSEGPLSGSHIGEREGPL